MAIKHYTLLVSVVFCFLMLVSGQTVASDPGVYGPPLELVHLYYDQFLPVRLFTQISTQLLPCSRTEPPVSRRDLILIPTPGIAVSATGRKFSNYPPTLDANNTRYGVAELTTSISETPYPSVEYNSPLGGFINYSTTPPSQLVSCFCENWRLLARLTWRFVMLSWGELSESFGGDAVGGCGCEG